MFEATQHTLEDRRRNPIGLVLSTAIHALFVAAILVIGARTVAEEADKIIDVKFYAPPPPPPPPPPPASSSTRTRTVKVVTPTEIVQPTEVVPVEEPTSADPPEEEVPGGVEGGVEGGDPIYGVLGGVLGGVPGGVVGGVLGGTGSTIADVTEGELRCSQAVQPEYPPLAKKQGITGEVVVRLIMGLDGRAESTDIVSGPAIFHPAALAAAKKKVCEPYRSGNVVSKARVTIRYKFTLQ